MSKISVCTIVAKNYLALAKTLGDSLRNIHPSVDFCVLVIDPSGLPENLEALIDTSWVKLVKPGDFMSSIQVSTFAYEYDITEFSTAIKPFLLEYLLSQSYEKVIYLDPDILIFQPLDKIFQALDESNIVLVPHILDPIPLDDCLPSEITLLQAGAYNLGFLGIAQSQETQKFLVWWKERLEKYCRIAHSEGLFVDQKWIDLVPGMFRGVQILTDRGYDVAYWNLNARHLSENNGTYFVDDEPLVFFHFSGFNPDKPDQLSKHQNRLKIETLPVLRKLLKYYAGLLIANGHSQLKSLPYGYSTFSNGVPIDETARLMLKHAKKAGITFLTPEDINADPSFFKWLNSPFVPMRSGTVGPHLTNYFFGIYQQRFDLQLAFPDVAGTHHDSYLSWVKAEAPKLGIHPAYLDSIRAGNANPSVGHIGDNVINKNDSISTVSFSSASFGVNVAGYLTAELGVGEAGRGYVAALKSLGVKTALTDFAIGTSSRKEDNTLSGFSSANPYPINLICINADQVSNFRDYIGSNYFNNKYNIGVWWWELPDFPEEWRSLFAQFNEIWVGSNFAYESISKHSPIPVIKIPTVVNTPAVKHYPKSHFGFADDEFLFLFVFDFFSIFERKNPLAIVKAFRKAFQPHEPVRLVLKCINGEHDQVNLNRLKSAIGDARISILDSYLSKDEKNGLIGACDCYVSLHRSEGFGLTLAEAMLLDKPVIATSWSGSMDFMTVNNSYPVEYELVQITEDHGPYKRGQIWAEPDTDHAAQLMRHVYEQPQEAQKKAKRGSADIRSMHSPSAAARAVKARLDLLQHAVDAPADKRYSLTPANAPSIATADLPPMPDLSPEIITGRGWASESRFGKFGLISKKIVERLIRFYINHQDRINRYLIATNQVVREYTHQQVAILTQSIKALEAETQQQSSSLSERLDAVENLQKIVQEHAEQNSLLIVVEKQTTSLTEQVDALQAELSSLAARASSLQAEFSRKTEELETGLNTLYARFRVRPYMQIPIFSPLKEEKQSFGYHLPSTQPYKEFDYRGFEEVFRGAEAFIKQRQAVYIPFFADKNFVLDVGCGRGEFLELLAEAGIQAVGLDTNADMVRHCSEKGFDNVLLEDCNSYLLGRDKSSLDGIFSAQLVEHLPFDSLYQFLFLSREKLTPGGVFIAETVNPHSIEAMKTFYVDLTHIKPLFPEVMLFLCRSAGFSKAQIFYPNGHGFSEEEYWLQGEYAVVAWR